MNLPILVAVVAVGAVAAWHVAGASAGPAYGLSVEEAEGRLREMSFEESMLTGTRFSLPTNNEGTVRTLRWAFGERGGKGPASSCTVALEALTPERTAAELDCALHDPKIEPAIAEPSRKLLKLVMSEHVESTLAGRPFDHSSMGRKLIAFSLVHRAVFAQQAAQLQSPQAGEAE